VARLARERSGHTGFYLGETSTLIWIEGGNESDALRRVFFPAQRPEHGIKRLLPAEKRAAAEDRTRARKSRSVADRIGGITNPTKMIH
jgi:hypothetical protein